MQITRLEYAGKNMFKTEIDGVVLKLDDETVVKKKLKIGMEITTPLFEQLAAASELIAAKTYTGNVLARSSATKKELEGKLMRRGYSKATREKTLAFLESHGFIDDELFAKNYVRYATEVKKMGKIKIKYELMRKGVSQQIAAEVLEDVDDSDSLVAAAKKELAKTDLRDRKTIEKMKRRLYAKGYSIYAINRFFSDLGGEDEI